MTRIVAVLALMAALAAGGILAGPLLNADRAWRHEEISLAAITALPSFVGQALAIDARAIERAIDEEWTHERHVGGLAALPNFTGQAAPAAIAPDPTITPGAIRTTNVGEICSTGTRELRHWDSERSELIFARYHIAREDRINFTLDHLVPLEMGGADTIENIWPQPRRSLAGEWDDTRKDQLERRLAVLVCSGQLDVVEAQRVIAEDWTAAYMKFLGEPR